MAAAPTWRGQYGTVLLGPTEDRVARYLATMTRHGRVTLRMADVMAAIRIDRSELYRITRRLRTLGLFGIEDDQGGTRGGRRIWRTPGLRPGARLHHGRHRSAWARITGWARHRAARLRTMLANHTPSPRPVARPVAEQPAPVPPGQVPAATDEPSPLGKWMRKLAPELAEAWDRDPARRPSRWSSTDGQ